MKAIGLSPRPQKLLWDAHSVVGAFCGLALFVIFFAGGFSLVHQELRLWERRTPREEAQAHPVERAARLDELEGGFELEGRDIQLRLPPSPSEPYRAFWQAGEDHPDADVNGLLSLELGVGVPEWIPMRGDNSLADLLFGLHFFRQLGQPGLYAAGFMSVFMLLGLVTGVLMIWSFSALTAPIALARWRRPKPVPLVRSPVDHA